MFSGFSGLGAASAAFLLAAASTWTISGLFWMVAAPVLGLFFFGLCIFVHELGHLVVAKWRRLHIDVFSIGFGRPLLTWTWQGIPCQISWIPFGGFVALPQLEPGDTPKSAAGAPVPLAQPYDRIVTAFAGPLCNLLFGLFLATVVWIIGVKGYPPGDFVLIDRVEKDYVAADGIRYPTPEYVAGLRVGDRLVAVNGRRLRNGWRDVQDGIVYAPGGQVRLTIQRNGSQLELPEYHSAPNPLLNGLGLPFFEPVFPVSVKSVIAGSPAAALGLRPYDELLKADGLRVRNSEFFVEKVQEVGRRGGDLAVLVRRDGKEFPVAIKPVPAYLTVGKLPPDSAAALLGLKEDDEVATVGGGEATDRAVLCQQLNDAVTRRQPLALTVRRWNEKTEKVEQHTFQWPPAGAVAGALDLAFLQRYMIGLGLDSRVLTHPTPWEQVTGVFTMTTNTVRGLTDKGSTIKTRHMSGPLGILWWMYLHFSDGLRSGLRLVCIITVSLGIFNLLPIPILDGGHILIGVVELIGRHRVPARIATPVSYFFVVLIIGFAVYITGWDLRMIIFGFGHRVTEKKPAAAAAPAVPGSTSTTPTPTAPATTPESRPAGPAAPAAPQGTSPAPGVPAGGASAPGPAPAAGP